MLIKSPVADPDLQIRVCVCGGGGGGGVGGSLEKNFFGPSGLSLPRRRFWPQFLLKIRRAPGPPGPSSESVTEVITK